MRSLRLTVRSSAVKAGVRSPGRLVYGTVSLTSENNPFHHNSKIVSCLAKYKCGRGEITSRTVIDIVAIGCV